VLPARLQALDLSEMLRNIPLGGIIPSPKTRPRSERHFFWRATAWPAST